MYVFVVCVVRVFLLFLILRLSRKNIFNVDRLRKKVTIDGSTDRVDRSIDRSIRQITTTRKFKTRAFFSFLYSFFFLFFPPPFLNEFIACRKMSRSFHSHFLSFSLSFFNFLPRTLPHSFFLFLCFFFFLSKHRIHINAI